GEASAIVTWPGRVWSLPMRSGGFVIFLPDGLKGLERVVFVDSNRVIEPKRERRLRVDDRGSAARHQHANSRCGRSGNRAHPGAESAIRHGSDTGPYCSSRSDRLGVPAHGGFATAVDDTCFHWKLPPVGQTDFGQLESKAGSS